MGYKDIMEAANGQEALAIIHSNDIDIILSDWNMPEMTGFELLQEVKNDELLQHIPFILVTAETSQENITSALRSGVNEIISKPFTLAVLETKIQQQILNVLNKRSEQQKYALAVRTEKVRPDQTAAEYRRVANY